MSLPRTRATWFGWQHDKEERLMARIRSIHPNACTSEKLARANGDEERCYWRLQTHCDDDGRAEDHPRLIWAALFPLNEDVGPEDVDKWLQGLNDIGLIRRYEVDGKRYLCVIGWSEKQSPRHPTPSKFPPPPELYGDPPQHDREAPEDDGQTCRGEGVEVGEGDGGGEGGVELALSSAAPTAVIDTVEAVFFAWQEATGHHKAVLDPKRRKRITLALKTHPAEDLIDACRGVALSPFHRGENDSRTVYDDLDVVLRDSAHIEKFRDLARGEGPAPPKLPKNAESVRRAVLAQGGAS